MLHAPCEVNYHMVSFFQVERLLWGGLVVPPGSRVGMAVSPVGDWSSCLLVVSATPLALVCILSLSSGVLQVEKIMCMSLHIKS